jgi:hypothetical protein
MCILPQNDPRIADVGMTTSVSVARLHSASKGVETMAVGVTDQGFFFGYLGSQPLGSPEPFDTCNVSMTVGPHFDMSFTDVAVVQDADGEWLAVAVGDRPFIVECRFTFGRNNEMVFDCMLRQVANNFVSVAALSVHVCDSDGDGDTPACIRNIVAVAPNGVIAALDLTSSTPEWLENNQLEAPLNEDTPAPAQPLFYDPDRTPTPAPTQPLPKDKHRHLAIPDTRAGGDRSSGRRHSALSWWGVPHRSSADDLPSPSRARTRTLVEKDAERSWSQIVPLVQERGFWMLENTRAYASLRVNMTVSFPPQNKSDSAWVSTPGYYDVVCPESVVFTDAFTFADLFAADVDTSAHGYVTLTRTEAFFNETHPKGWPDTAEFECEATSSVFTVYVGPNNGNGNNGQIFDDVGANNDQYVVVSLGPYYAVRNCYVNSDSLGDEQNLLFSLDVQGNTATVVRMQITAEGDQIPHSDPSWDVSLQFHCEGMASSHSMSIARLDANGSVLDVFEQGPQLMSVGGKAVALASGRNSLTKNRDWDVWREGPFYLLYPLPSPFFFFGL